MARKNTKQSAPGKTSKNDKVIALLKRDGGTSLEEITKATGWLPHSARAVLTGFRKKGFKITRTKTDGITRWTIAGAAAQ